MKNPVKSKTNWFALSLAVLGAILDNLPETRAILSDYYGVILVVISAIVAYLRYVTKEPVGYQ